MQSRAPRPLTVSLLVLMLCLIWGSTWLVIREGLEDLPPMTSAAARFLLAFAVMCLVAPRLARSEGGERPPAWLWIIAGLTNFGISFGIVYYCETILPSGLVSVLWGVFPLLVAGAGHFFLPAERLRPRQAVGFVLGFAGLVVLFATDLRGLGPDAVPTGLLLLVSPVVCTVGNIVLKRYATGMSSALINRNALGVGAAMLVLAAVMLDRDAEAVWSARATASVVYLAVIGSCVTFSVYFWLLRHAPVNRLALIAFVTPCIALLLGWAFADEPITGNTIAGTATVLVGIGVVVRR